MTRITAALAKRLVKAAGKPPAAPQRAKRPVAAPVPKESAGEAAMGAALRLLGADIPTPVRELRFAWPDRRWRFDFAWPDHGLAVEVDGGQYAPGGGRHAGDADREKLNHAAARGWRVLRFSPQQLERDPIGCVALVRRALEATP